MTLTSRVIAVLLFQSWVTTAQVARMLDEDRRRVGRVLSKLSRPGGILAREGARHRRVYVVQPKGLIEAIRRLQILVPVHSETPLPESLIDEADFRIAA